jgi:hypothetical protein
MFSLPFNYKDNISLGNVTSFLSNASDSGAYVEWLFKSDGTGESYAGGGLVDNWTWCTPANAAFADNYEILFNFGTNITPDPNQVWYALSQNRSFGYSTSPLSGPSDGKFTFFLRRIGSDLILDLVTVEFQLDSGA